MTTEEPKPINPFKDAVRSYAHAIGLRLVKSREFVGQPGELGIVRWADAVIEAIKIAKSRKEWDYQIPDENTVHRQINYLADPNWVCEDVPRPPGEKTLWLHVPKKIWELDARTGEGRPQSTYKPNPEAYTD